VSNPNFPVIAGRRSVEPEPLDGPVRAVRLEQSRRRATAVP